MASNPTVAGATALAGSGARPLEIILASDEPVWVDGVDLREFSPPERHQLTRLVQVLETRGRRVRIRRNREHRVGRVHLGDTVVTIPPPFDPAVFIDFFLYASGRKMEDFLRRRTAETEARLRRRDDPFLVLLAGVLVDAAEQIVATRVARGYEPVIERSRTISGRPLWGRDFGHHPAEGITCRYFVLSTDNLLNRLVSAGIRQAASILRDTPMASVANTQRFIWRSIADQSYVTPHDFDLGERRITRLTEPYRDALAISRALLYGFSLENPFAGRSTRLQVLEFSLPELFERFLSRLLSEASVNLGLRVHIQAEDRHAIVDAEGTIYRRVRPDIVVFRGSQPVAVVDAKFKPHYTRTQRGKRVPPKNRVSNADIYQMFFYQARIRARYRLERSPRAIIVAPLLQQAAEIVESERRTALWQTEELGSPEFGLSLVPLPVVSVVRSIQDGRGGLAVLESASELAAHLVACAEPAV